MAKKPTTRRKTTRRMSEPKTLEQKLAAAEALVAKYKAAIANEQALRDVQVGDNVTFKYGRAGLGEGVRTLTGTVKAMQEIEEGTAKGLNLRVEVGEGFDAELFKVHARDIVSNASADERKAAAPADADPLNAA